MKQFLLLLSSFVLLNCSTQNQENKYQTTKEVTELTNEQPSSETTPTVEQLRDSSFNSFLIKFSENQEFQLRRVDFPFNVKLIDIEDIEETVIIARDEWQHENLLDTVGIKTRQYNKYSQTTEVADSMATIKLRGIDNGIRINYNFQLRKGRWYLTDIFNSST